MKLVVADINTGELIKRLAVGVLRSGDVKGGNACNETGWDRQEGLVNDRLNCRAGKKTKQI